MALNSKYAIIAIVPIMAATMFLVGKGLRKVGSKIVKRYDPRQHLVDTLIEDDSVYIITEHIDTAYYKQPHPPDDPY